MEAPSLWDGLRLGSSDQAPLLRLRSLQPCIQHTVYIGTSRINRYDNPRQRIRKLALIGSNILGKKCTLMRMRGRSPASENQQPRGSIDIQEEGFRYSAGFCWAATYTLELLTKRAFCHGLRDGLTLCGKDISASKSRFIISSRKLSCVRWSSWVCETSAKVIIGYSSWLVCGHFVTSGLNN
jgi:hypothetical protein